jgi:hypothetical protein
MKEFNPYLKEILEEMCIRAGTSFDKVNWGDEEWYLTHSWTEDQQEDFEDWLVEYWYNNKAARRYMISGTFIKNKGRLRLAAKEFLFLYGWTFK